MYSIIYNYSYSFMYMYVCIYIYMFAEVARLVPSGSGDENGLRDREEDKSNLRKSPQDFNKNCTEKLF